MNNKEVAKLLLDIKAVALNAKEPYRYTSGILSPIYCDNRLIMSFPQKRRQIINTFLELIEEKGYEFDVIAGVATGAITYAAWLAEKLDVPMIYIRGKAKGHGKQNQIEGKLEKGQKVLVIEDLISTGGSSASACAAVRQAGGEVTNCLAIFSYQMQSAKENFKDIEVELTTLTEFSTLVETASELGYITAEEKEKVLAWNQDPQEWGKKMGYE